MGVEKSKDSWLKDLNKDLKEYGSLLEELGLTAVKDAKKLSKEEQKRYASELLYIKEAEKARKRSLDKIQKLNASALAKRKAAEASLLEDILDKQIQVEETIAQLQAENLYGYANAQMNLIQQRRSAELKLVQDIHEAQAKAGAAENSSLGQLIDSSMRERSELERSKQQAKKDVEGLFGKGKTFKERAAVAGDMFNIGKKAKSSKITAGTTSEAKAPELNSQAKDIKTGVVEALKETKVADITATVEEGQKESQKGGLANGLLRATKALASIAEEMNGTIESIEEGKTAVDARLKGASYSFEAMNNTVSAVMLDGSVKAENVMNNLKAVVQKGIARDVAQMGMIETVKERIAPTFDTFNGTMLRLIRIQNENTTYARLGIESSMTQLLNQMYSTTEYLSSIASSVKSSLEEAEALMGAKNAISFEYQVQKWLGSLSSAGMSDSGVTAIADAVGKLAAGQIEGITNGGAGNLLIMAANNSNQSIAEILANGLDESATNSLLNSAVNYLQDLVGEANGNKVVQQQLAKVFGLTASDLKAAVNLATTYNTQSTLNGMLGGYNAALDAAGRAVSVSAATWANNLWANVKYSTAASIAGSPLLSMVMKTGDILDSLASGIPIPAITAFGTGVDTKLTVSDILRTASLVGGFTKSLVASLSSGGLSASMGIAANGQKSGGSQVKISSGSTTSSSGNGQVINGNVDDMTNSATTESKGKAKKQTVQAKEEADEVSNKTINSSILSIYNILNNVVEGDATLSVKLGGSGGNSDEPMKVIVANPWDIGSGRYSNINGTLTDNWVDNAVTGGVSSWTPAAGIL